MHQNLFLIFMRKITFLITVKLGDLRWPCKGTDLTDTEVNVGKYLFVRGCIDMLEDEWLTFIPSIAFFLEGSYPAMFPRAFLHCFVRHRKRDCQQI